MNRIRRNGFLIVTALLIMIVLLLLGMGFLGSQANRYRSVSSAAQAAQARQIALAGLEDARVKLQNDLDFPPKPAAGQSTFTYCENFTIGPSGDTQDANYQVLINATYAVDPYDVYEIQSIGTIGNATNPTAQYTLNAEVSINATASLSNVYYRYTHVSDDSSL